MINSVLLKLQDETVQYPRTCSLPLIFLQRKSYFSPPNRREKLDNKEHLYLYTYIMKYYIMRCHMALRLFSLYFHSKQFCETAGLTVSFLI